MGPPITLPLSFKDCFASNEGLARLHGKIDANLEENVSLLAFFKAKAGATRTQAQDLFSALPTEAASQSSWDYDDGASTKRAVLSLFRETHQQAQSYRKVAMDLDKKLIDPFESWVDNHKDRILQARKTLSAEYLVPLEKGLNEVRKHRDTYESKCIKLEEEEDEARHHGSEPSESSHSLPNSPPSSATLKKTPLSALSIPENSKSSPHSPKAIMSPAQDSADAEDNGNISLNDLEKADNPNIGLKRKPTVTDRLKALARDPKNPSSAIIDVIQEGADEKAEPKEEGPKIIELAGLSNGTREWSSLFRQAHKELPKRSLKIPIVGVYSDVHSGAELVDYFVEHLMVEGNRARTVEFLRQLSEDLLCLRLVGEIGNEFRDSPDSFYQFKEDAFHLDTLHEKPAQQPLPPSEPSSPALSGASSMLSRSNTLLSSWTSSFTPASPGTKLHKARQEASSASIAYKAVVKRVDFLRLNADQQIELYLSFLQRAALDRVRFLKTTLARYSAIIEPVQAKSKYAEEINVLQEAMNAEQDVQSICELYRVTTGYRPRPIVFQDHYNEGLDVAFGVELSRWVEVQEHNSQEVGVPDVLKAMLDHLQEGYAKVASATDKRRVWYLDVPLTASHRLRQALNDTKAPGGVPTNLLRQSDLPVVAATVKLYFLELENPPLPYVQYEDLKALYKDSEKTASDEVKVAALKELLLRVPRINLLVIDALVSHLKELMESTRGEDVDSDEAYLTKLGLSIGRCLVRPKIDTSLTLTDRAPLHFLSDLVRLRDEILPSTIEARAQREKDRFKPQRKRTAPVDQRLSRSSLGGGLDANDQQRLLEEQMHRKDPSSASKASEKNDLPPLPVSSPTPAARTSAIRSTPTPPPKQTQPIASANAEDAPFVPPESSPEEEETDTFQDNISSPSVNPRTISPIPPKAPSPPAKAPEPTFAPSTEQWKPMEDKPEPAEAIDYTPRAAKRTSRIVEDAPFNPPAEDAPFVPPDENVPITLQTNNLARSSSNGQPSPLSRSTRVTRGPRPLSMGEGARPGTVAAAAQRFGNSTSSR